MVAMLFYLVSRLLLGSCCVIRGDCYGVACGYYDIPGGCLGIGRQLLW